MKKGLIILAAGGTGGHLFPAQALAEVLAKRNYDVHLMTDERVRDYGKGFMASKTHIVHSATLTVSKPFGLPKQALTLFKGFLKARKILKAEKPLAVIGFGGYPSFPPLFAARSLKIPTAVHEQNSVLGRANKVLAARVDKIATSFKSVIGLPEHLTKKVAFTGNPVRALALKQAGAAYKAPKAYGSFSLVVFGGSQGAKFFSDFMPKVFEAMGDEERRRIKLIQQCRVEDIEAVRRKYQEMGIGCELEAFFADMPQKLADAHLVLCRSGASSIAELGVIGRPAAFVPLPNALDNDQLRNAQTFANAGGGWVFPQGELQPQEFAGFITRLMDDSSALKKGAVSALAQGVPDAAERLADLTLGLALARRT